MRSNHVEVLNCLISSEELAAIEWSEKACAAILENPRAASTSTLISFLNPDMIRRGVPRFGASDDWEMQFLKTITSEIDRRIPVPAYQP